VIGAEAVPQDDIKTVAGWRGNQKPLELTPEDSELVDLVLSIYPELRVVFEFGRRMRAKNAVYPIASADALAEFWGEETVVLEGHRIDAESIIGMTDPEWFPLAHEGELLSIAHIALVRCRIEGVKAFVEQQQPQDSKLES
jgi:hypothetical protein